MGAGQRQYRIRAQQGLSLTGLIFMLAVLGSLLVLGLRVTPAVVEYQSIKKGIGLAKEKGGSPHEIRQAFDKNASVNDISSVRGRDLTITRDGGELEINFDYDKRIPLAGNASLVLHFTGTTDRSGVVHDKSAAVDQ